MISSETSSSQAALFQRDHAARTASFGASGNTAGIRQKAQELVGSTFFGLLLKELRKSTGKSTLFSGGHGEDTLRPELDRAVISRLAASPRFALVDEIVCRTTRNTPASNVRSPDHPDILRAQQEAARP